MDIFDLNINDRIQIGDDLVIEILKRTGTQVKIGIEAPRDVKVYRKELYDHLHATE